MYYELVSTTRVDPGDVNLVRSLSLLTPGQTAGNVTPQPTEVALTCVSLLNSNGHTHKQDGSAIDMHRVDVLHLDKVKPRCFSFNRLGATSNEPSV